MIYRYCVRTHVGNEYWFPSPEPAPDLSLESFVLTNAAGACLVVPTRTISKLTRVSGDVVETVWESKRELEYAEPERARADSGDLV